MTRKALVALVSSLLLAASADELAIARQALRDGLGSVARTHAARVGTTEGRLTEIESYAREGSWREVIRVLDAVPDETDETFRYYRALALTRLQQTEAAVNLLAGQPFTTLVLRQKVLLLRAELARRAGRPEEVLALSAEKDFPPEDVDALMLVAWAREATGDRERAWKAWRAVLANDQADERAVAAAAAGLGDAATLQAVLPRLQHVALRLAVGLRLGRLLLAEERTFAEGERMVRTLAKESPDADGAKDAFLALADRLVQRGSSAEAVEAYQNALEAWPETAKEMAVQEGYAWALRKQNRLEEAVSGFGRALEVATQPNDRARLLLAQGETLSDLGRGGEAMKKFRQVLENYPQTPTGKGLKVKVELRELESAGRSLFRNFDFDGAREKFAELARRAPERQPRMAYFEMLCLYGQGLDAEAVKQAEALAADSADVVIRAEATLWLAKYSYNAGRWRESCRLFADYATNRAPSSVQAPSALTWAARAAFAEGAYQSAVDLVTMLTKEHPAASERTAAWLIQGQALVKLVRQTEAIKVFERVILAEDAVAEDRYRARLLKADAQFVMGADNPVRYREALDGYRSLLLGETRAADDKIDVAFKIGRTLEKLGRMDEAIDQYYTEVVLAFRDGVKRKIAYSEGSKGRFAQAAYRLADEFERRGADDQAMKVLRLVVTSGVGTAEAEAKSRLKRLQRKGSLQ